MKYNPDIKDSASKKRLALLTALAYGLRAADSFHIIEAAWAHSYLYPPQPQRLAQEPSLIKQRKQWSLEHLLNSNRVLQGRRQTHIKNQVVKVGKRPKNKKVKKAKSSKK